MSKFTKIFAIILAASALAGVAGCRKKTTDSSVSTSANWNVRISNSVESNSIDYWRNHKEVARYSLDFSSGANKTYSVDYDTENAEYYTEFYIDKNDYDWNSEDIPEDYRSDDSEPVYVFATTLKVAVTYTHGSRDESVTFDDEIYTECKFRLASEGLEPVYSLQKITDTAPVALNLRKDDPLENAYERVDAVYKTFYNRDCTEASTYTAQKDEDGEYDFSHSPETQSLTQKKLSYSIFDNSQLRAAVRAMTLSSSGTKVFNVYIPQSAAMQNCQATIAESKSLDSDDEDHKKIIDALDNAPDDYIFFKDEDRSYRYNAVTLSVNSKLAGPSVTQWYSSIENADVNYCRCVMLRVSSPLSFYLGTLNYYLSELSVEKF